MRKSRGDKTPQIEIDARVAKVSELVLAGASRAQIVRFCADKFNASDDTADRYVAAARKELQELVQPDKKEELNKAKARYEALYAKCLSTQDYKGAASVQDRICDLLGLWKSDLTVKHEAGDTLTLFMEKIRAGTFQRNRSK
jgi:hypothetical protein